MGDWWAYPIAVVGIAFVTWILVAEQGDEATESRQVPGFSEGQEER
jgi:hypothetical protein